ncbi:hypothetical protein NP493_413g02072 [Ridgeia piscesae]|uniref:Uncharacterized protein n=1 Tax=Ridgeia piscesae TaxID=27915 RepID=A0AAD9L0G5_RIDPI|nr:hypothetical protein NP493_413g02072 [Ridgeia piscesae]
MSGQRDDIATIAGKLGYVSDSSRSVRRSLSHSGYRSTVVIRKHGNRNQYRLQPLRPTYNEATSSEGTSTTTLSTSAPPIGFTQLFPVEGDAIFSGATEHIYDVPRETTLHRRASNPEMGHVHVYDTPEGPGTGRHVSDPLPQIQTRRLSSRSSEQTADLYDNADENIYDVPRNCDDFDTASTTQFAVDDVYDAPIETDDIYVVPSNLLLPIPTCDSIVAPTLSLPIPTCDSIVAPTLSLPIPTCDSIVAPTLSLPIPTCDSIVAPTLSLPIPTCDTTVAPTLVVQTDENTDDTAVLIAPEKGSKPSVPPKPPRRRGKPVQPENVYAVPRKLQSGTIHHRRDYGYNSESCTESKGLLQSSCVGRSSDTFG